jgi:hypothetical protein
MTGTPSNASSAWPTLLTQVRSLVETNENSDARISSASPGKTEADVWVPTDVVEAAAVAEDSPEATGWRHTKLKFHWPRPPPLPRLPPPTWVELLSASSVWEVWEVWAGCVRGCIPTPLELLDPRSG